MRLTFPFVHSRRDFEKFRYFFESRLASQNAEIVLRDSVKNFRTHGQNCELENTQINGSSFGLAGSMGTGSGQSLDDTATTSWSLISQGHMSLET